MPEIAAGAAAAGTAATAGMTGMTGIAGKNGMSGLAGITGLPKMPPSPPARPSLCFMRTELGNQQVRSRQPMLPLHIARLLLLFESPQTVDDLRRMIDEPWLPEALIELERRRLIQRAVPPTPAPQNLLAIPMRHGCGNPSADRRRGLTRIMFLRQLGTLGTDMARRIDQCQSDQELDELLPQVDALIEAIAGREALGQFRLQTARSS